MPAHSPMRAPVPEGRAASSPQRTRSHVTSHEMCSVRRHEIGPLKDRSRDIGPNTPIERPHRTEHDGTEHKATEHKAPNPKPTPEHHDRTGATTSGLSRSDTRDSRTPVPTSAVTSRSSTTSPALNPSPKTQRYPTPPA